MTFEEELVQRAREIPGTLQQSFWASHGNWPETENLTFNIRHRRSSLAGFYWWCWADQYSGRQRSPDDDDDDDDNDGGDGDDGFDGDDDADDGDDGNGDGDDYCQGDVGLTSAVVNKTIQMMTMLMMMLGWPVRW